MRTGATSPLGSASGYHRHAEAGFVSWQPNGSTHADLVLRLGAQCQRVDSYYFALDGQKQSPTTATGTGEPIRLLVQQWLGSIEAASVGEYIYLPFGLFDQGTSVVGCEIQPGHTCVMTIAASCTE